MRVFSKGSDSGRCLTLCCLYRVLAITLSWTVRKNDNMLDDRVLNTGRQRGHTCIIPEPRDTSAHRATVLIHYCWTRFCLPIYLFESQITKIEHFMEIDREVNKIY